VFLGRRPQEPVDQELQAFYAKHLNALKSPIFREGQWSLCGRGVRPDNTSFQNLVAWAWLKENDHLLIVVNLSEYAVQARVQFPWGDARWDTWRLGDASSDLISDRDGREMLHSGLYLELGPWDCHFFQSSRPGNTKSIHAAAAGA
jgi:hypothetical protein